VRTPADRAQVRIGPNSLVGRPTVAVLSDPGQTVETGVSCQHAESLAERGACGHAADAK
jgi:hypothetical protein